MANAQGRLAEAYTATTQTGSKVTDLGLSYSPRGEQTDVYELTPHSGGFYHVVQSYWANGNLKTLSGLGLPTITYGVNGQGQTSTVNASTGTNPVSSTSYNASGQVTGVTFGSLDAAAFSFDNNTGRMTQYKETINGSATFGTIGWNANGTPSSLAITDPFNALNGGKTCTFGYDDLIRVSSTSCTGSIWSQTFTYDPFGNITKTGNSAWNPGYNSATNRYTLGGTSYDANGNLLNDTFHAYTWNSDGQVLSVDSTGLTYDALGRQVERTNGAGYVQYVYAGSTKLALMNGQTLTRAFIPLPGGTQGVYTTSFSKYRVPDWLGSFRIESTSTRTWGFSGAFAPFGERYAEGGSAAAKTFAGHNWDTVSDLYDAQFREQSGAQGRWVSPDPAGLSAAGLIDPQTWNRYVYVRNNPLLFVDPLGLWRCPTCPQDPPPPPDFIYHKNAWGAWPDDAYQAENNLKNMQSRFNTVYLGRVLELANNRLLSKLKGLIPSACSGGGFGYAGTEFDIGFLKFESLTVVAYDSKIGGQHGGIVAGGAGRFTGGVESTRTWSDWQEHTSPIGFVNGAQPLAPTNIGPLKVNESNYGGLVQFESGQLTVGGYLGGANKQTGRGAGGGGYITLSWTGCHN